MNNKKVIEILEDIRLTCFYGTNGSEINPKTISLIDYYIEEIQNKWDKL